MSRFLFRCDGSIALGMGHVTRCCALAMALRERGHTVCFVMADPLGGARAVVQSAGFRIEVIPATDSATDFGLGESDLERTTELAERLDVQAVVVDHPTTTVSYFLGLKRSGVILAILDDLAERDLAAADWVLNQNFGVTAPRYITLDHQTALLGPTYALVRPEFLAARKKLVRQFSDDDRRVLLTFGLGDTASQCADVVEALQEVPEKLEVRCVFSGGSESSARLVKIVSASRHAIQLFQDWGDMVEHMTWADLSINGGGSTCWELCCLGVPMVVVELAPNQASNVSGLHQQGCAHSLGDWHPERFAGDLARVVECLLNHPEKRADMSAKAQVLVDGSGPARAAESLIRLVEERKGGWR